MPAREAVRPDWGYAEVRCGAADSYLTSTFLGWDRYGNRQVEIDSARHLGMGPRKRTDYCRDPDLP